MKKINRIHQFDNGLVLLAEEMSWSNSVAFAILLPCGSIYDPNDQLGLSSLTCEMSLRGAGLLDNRHFLQALENLGVQSSETVSQSYSVFCAAMLPNNLSKTLELYADLLRRPLFPEDQLEPSKQVINQEILAVEDEPSRKMMIELGRNFFPDPWGRPSFGTEQGLKAISLEAIRRHHQDYYQPNGAIISIAGSFDWNELKNQIETLFGDWQPYPLKKIEEKNIGSFVVHIPYESAQTHIGLAFPSIPFNHPDYLLAWSGCGILSGGMSCRLFSEVREKRGLCYTVSASYYTHRNRGAVFCYCGSRAAQAQEALDVLISELQKLSQKGIEQPELDRLKIRAKSSLIMQQESSIIRAGSIARDWYHLSRIRSMEEIEQKINALSCEVINEYLAAHPAQPFRLVTLGSESLTIADELLG